MDRRTLLQAAGGLAAPGLSLAPAFSLAPVFAARAYATPASDQKVLVVFLRGAYDAANIVIPTGSDFYYQARPTLQIARPDPSDPNASLPLDADWSLHPALKDSIYPLWQAKEVAFIPFAGTDDMSRSHFETQARIERGESAASPGLSSGFMGRLAREASGAKPISFTDVLPTSFRGAGDVPNIGVAALSAAGVDPRQKAMIENMYRSGTLSGVVRQGFDIREQAMQAVSGPTDPTAPKPAGFALAMSRVARLMRLGYSLGFIDVGGWDTHVNQGAATGTLAQRAAELGKGLARFAQDMKPDLWRNTTVVVISEFGRTFRQNGDNGTDHGHGSVYWVLGGSVRGGRMVGEQVQVAERTLNQNRDLPVLNDYRSILGGVFRQAYGLSAKSLDTVFPGAPQPSLTLI